MHNIEKFSRTIIDKEKGDVSVDNLAASEMPAVLTKAFSEWVASVGIECADVGQLFTATESTSALTQLAEKIQAANKWRHTLVSEPVDLLAANIDGMPPELLAVAKGTVEHLPLELDNLAKRAAQCFRCAEVLDTLLTGGIPVTAIVEFFTGKAERKLAAYVYDAMSPGGHGESATVEVERRRRIEEFVRQTREWFERASQEEARRVRQERRQLIQEHVRQAVERAAEVRRVERDDAEADRKDGK